jgi:hypothetical protein
MRAMDDALSVHSAASPSPRRPIVTLGLVVLLGALPGAAIFGLLAERFAPDHLPRYESRIPWSGPAPVPAEWPRVLRAGESAEIFQTPRGPTLSVRSTTAADAEALAGELSRRHSLELTTYAQRRTEARLNWKRGLPIGPQAELSPAAECLARVYARASVARALVAAVPPRASATRAGIATPIEFDALLHREAECDRLALAADPEALGREVVAAGIAETAWLEAVARALPSGAAARTAGLWRAHALLRAAELDLVGHAIEEQVPAIERSQAGLAVRERCLVIEPGCPDPGPALLAGVSPLSALPPARPIPLVWEILFAAGAAAGVALMFPLAAWLSPRLSRSAPRRAKPESTLAPASAAALVASQGVESPPSRLAATDVAWLHVVSGPDSPRIMDALWSLSAQLCARGQRVLLIDGGRRLRLHETLGGDSRWGLVECLAGEMPLLGSVQSAGQAGLYLLAHGNVARDERWAALGRLLEDARPHFGHVVVALEFATPHVVGDVLAGRTLEGWWAETGSRLPRAAVAFAERLGIALHPMELWAGEAAAPEPSSSPGVQPLEELSVVEVEPVEGPSPLEVPKEPAIAFEPLVLDCDLQVRERLRFLLWMRRVQAEGRREDARVFSR